MNRTQLPKTTYKEEVPVILHVDVPLIHILKQQLSLLISFMAFMSNISSFHLYIIDNIFIQEINAATNTLFQFSFIKTMEITILIFFQMGFKF